MTGKNADEALALIRYVHVLQGKGMHREAASQLQEALVRDPDCVQAHYQLALLQHAEGRPELAARHFQEALSREPGDVKALNCLGVVFQELGRANDSADCYSEALRLDPDYLEARINLVLLLKDHGRLCAAQRQLEEALTHHPEAVRLRYNLANLLQLQGRCLEAVAQYREVLRLDPEHLGALQNLLFALHYSPQIDDRQIFQEHLAAARAGVFHPGTLPARPPRGPGERVRVGYLSPDFRGHSVASFIEPILARHDRARFEIYCYANLGRPDATTERLRGLAEHWRDIYPLSDGEAALLIARDGIDILVDLAGHTSGNRLPLLTRKPAPLQVTWLGYPDGTGLPEMDFRITDRLSDPPGASDTLHRERLIRLEPSFCCYQPPSYAPEVAPPPCLASGRITFGSFNNLAKVTPELIALWTRVLLAVPGSRLMMKCSPLADAEVCERILEAFGAGGVAADRIDLSGGEAQPADHLARYAELDIALDTSPYNGTTTTCEALWMGVPVVTLAGSRHASRTGLTLLTNCGLGELVTQSPEEYLELAVRLAEDFGRLAVLRTGLRERMASGPLLDAARVTLEVERAYEGMLEEYRRREP
jgi:predicted O-linked N-acetylglucosamine transferase (SPINDLY family)